MLSSFIVSLSLSFILAAWGGMKLRLFPQDLVFLASRVWPSDLWNQMLLIFAITLSFTNHYISYLIRSQSGVVVNDLHSHGSPDLLAQTIGFWTLPLLEAFPYIGQLVELRLSHFWETRICKEVFAHLMDLSADFHTGTPIPERLRYVQKVKLLVKLVEMGLFTLLPTAASLIFNAFFLSRTIGRLPAVGITAVGLLHVCMAANSEKWTSTLSDEMRRTEQKCGLFLHQRIEHWYLVLCFSRKNDEKQLLHNVMEDKNTADRRYSDKALTFMGFQDAVLSLVKRAAVVITIHRISRGAVDIGSLVVLLECWTDIFLPIRILTSRIHQIGLLRSTAKEISELLCKMPTITDDSSDALRVDGGKVMFENVSFSYTSDTPILRGVTLTAEAGETIAVVGETGCGKSTMLNLLFRLYDVQEGCITIDGQNLKNVSVSSLRDVIGVVPQEAQLFSGTIEENVKYGRPGATDNEMYDACALAAIHGTIKRFPDGYLTRIGDGGRKLSGGEARRIAIARAVIKKPRIFILDEPTSSVDLETETHIQDGLKKACDGCTTFIVAHRLSTIRYAKKILVLENGQILEKGSHQDLLELDGKYCAMWQKHIGSS